MLHAKNKFPGTRLTEVIDLLLRNKINDDARLIWKPQFLGNTGYIDSIQAEDVTRAFMWGIDAYDRFFVTIRTRLGECPDLGVTRAMEIHGHPVVTEIIPE